MHASRLAYQVSAGFVEVAEVAPANVTVAATSHIAIYKFVDVAVRVEELDETRRIQICIEEPISDRDALKISNAVTLKKSGQGHQTLRLMGNSFCPSTIRSVKNGTYIPP